MIFWMFFYLLYKNPIFVSVVKKLYTCFFRSIVKMKSAFLREESQINGVGIFYTAFFAINFSHSKHFCTRTEVSENKRQLYTAGYILLTIVWAIVIQQCTYLLIGILLSSFIAFSTSASERSLAEASLERGSSITYCLSTLPN